jgi:hypothetical protein
MTTPSNDKFYEWGYHNPYPSEASQNPVLPLTDKQKNIFTRILSTANGDVELSGQMLPSGSAFQDYTKFYGISTVSGVHISSPALFPHPDGEGDPIERGQYYWSSGNYYVWPSPEGEDRYSAYWWDASGIYFTPSVYLSENASQNNLYYAYPTSNPSIGGSIFLFDDLDQDAYWNQGVIKYNQDKKYLLWLDGKNVHQLGVFNYGKQLIKTVLIPVGYNKKKRKRVYKEDERKYYYSHFSSATHNIVDKGFEDFQIFYTYIHYVPRIKSATSVTHENPVDVKRRPNLLNEIPFISNAKTVYLYSVYGAGKFKDLQSENWTSVNYWDSEFSPKGVPSDFHGILKSPTPPFPAAERTGEESEEEEYNSKEKLQQKFEAVSGLLGL